MRDQRGPIRDLFLGESNLKKLVIGLGFSKQRYHRSPCAQEKVSTFLEKQQTARFKNQIYLVKISK